MTKNLDEKNRIVLEPATQADFKKIIEIENKLAGKTYVPLGNEEQLVKLTEKGPIYLINKGGQTVGLVLYYKQDDGSIYLDALAIDLQYQGMGLGRKAMEMVLEKIKDSKKIWLVTHPENKAVKLYESLGFKLIERKENYFGNGEPRLILSLERS